MATTYQNPSRLKGRLPIQKSQVKKTTSRQPPPTITNNTKEIKKRFGNHPSQNSMHPSSSILRKKPITPASTDQFNQNVADWRHPSDLEKVKSRPFYSPIHTPPRLRTLITPPGIASYYNNHDLRRLRSPLAGVDNWRSASVGLDTWGLEPTDYRYNTNLNLIRRHPSPLSHYGLESTLQRQKKSYIVIPHLNDFVSPPVSSGGAHFILPSRRVSPVYVPTSQYNYLRRIDSFAARPFHRESSDYVYVRQNEAFANRYIEEFIGKCIEDQFIPDILLEIIGELEQESKTQGGNSYKTQIDRYNAELNRRIHQRETIDRHLQSDDWMRELEHQHAPASNMNTNISSLKPTDFHEIVPVQTTSRVRYHDLPPDVQGRLLADINQELIDFEIQTLMTDLSGQSLTTVPVVTDHKREVIHDTHHSQKQRIDQAQYNDVEKYARNKLLDTTCLDQLLRKYIKQHGSVVDIDDLSRLLDGNILGNLVSEYQNIDENRSRTSDNYGAKKFHLNSFMNITMDLLLTELSASLIEDMKDVNEQERRIFS